MTRTDILLSLIIIIVGSVSFLLGRLSVSEKTTKIHQTANLIESQITVATSTTSPTVPTPNQNILNIQSSPQVVPTQPQKPVVNIDGNYVASKSGTKYHLPWCSGAKRITDANKVWFKTKEEAEKAGYQPAANCKGI